jgi:hypothetical protein
MLDAAQHLKARLWEAHAAAQTLGVPPQADDRQQQVVTIPVEGALLGGARQTVGFALLIARQLSLGECWLVPDTFLHFLISLGV